MDLRRTLALATRAGPPAVAVGTATTWFAPQGLSRRPLRSRFFPTLSGRGAPHRVALTFDDGPDRRGTPRILDALDRLGWRATFFMLGDMAQREPALAAEVVAAGHEVAVHGFRHRSHLVRTARDLRDDVARAVDAVALASGRAPRWFRPPYGSVTWATLSAARAAGLQTVLWTAWGRDWRPEATVDSVVEDVARQLGPGATVLLHDSDCTSAPGSFEVTAAALEPLGRLFSARHLIVGTLAEHGLREAAAW
jgi:peptidoglycan/xylan/chitin deacetylase (PgdA/CDA1 family)